MSFSSLCASNVYYIHPARRSKIARSCASLGSSSFHTNHPLPLCDRHSTWLVRPIPPWTPGDKAPSEEERPRGLVRLFAAICATLHWRSAASHPSAGAGAAPDPCRVRGARASLICGSLSTLLCPQSSIRDPYKAATKMRCGRVRRTGCYAQ
jgi:hypothetical protein